MELQLIDLITTETAEDLLYDISK